MYEFNEHPAKTINKTFYELKVEIFVTVKKSRSLSQIAKRLLIIIIIITR